MSRIVKNTAYTLIIPVFVLVLFILLTSINGISLFGNHGHVLTFVRSTVVIAFTAWALGLNLDSGRFDFSIGSVSLLSSLIGAKLAVTYDLSPGMMFVLIALTGMLLGLVSGLAYITLKLPPLILSLGITLIYEAFTFVITGGEGLLISTNLSLVKLSSLENLLWMAGAGLVLMIFLANFTGFGYNLRALQHGQKIAVHTGVNEKRNAVACYMLAGLLMGVVGSINITTRGSASVVLNFSSISLMFTAFLPLFLGGFIGRYSEEKLGIFLGSVTSAIITLGFVRLDVSSQMQSLFNAIILLLFLVYLNNENKVKELVFLKERSRMNRASARSN
ncbi:ABC transporter permease [Paenibacillus tepidiphilus]|uniref:ABC transporter permease n=1 Tax=Paenibacillus tepidiphilus TaxID=2608683 RepID=UPI001EEF8EA2|nr:hypothetical protein [Paenibacillus tepidiphilus]